MRVFVVVLAVGRGVRMFPLSVRNSPKYLLPAPSGNGESLLAAQVRRAALVPGAKVIVATVSDLVSRVRREVVLRKRRFNWRRFLHLQNSAKVISVAAKMGSLKSIPLIASRIATNEDDIVLFVPSDQDYSVHDTLVAAALSAVCLKASKSDKIVYAVTPVETVDTRFGYLEVPEADTGDVRKFIEKPDPEQVKQIAPGRDWYTNSAIMAGTRRAWAQVPLSDASDDADFDTDFAQHNPGRLSAQLCKTLSWVDLGSPKAYFQATDGSSLLGRTHTVVGDEPPFVLHLSRDGLQVVVDARLGRGDVPVAVIAGNGIVAVVGVDKLDEMNTVAETIDGCL